MFKWTAVAFLPFVFIAGAGPATTQSATVVYENDFRHGLDDFSIEQEKPATVTAQDGTLTLDAPAGLTVWLKQKLTGPVVIEYEATAVRAGGKNDRVSDLNCFWMANDPKHPDALLTQKRSGRFADYDTLTTYYVGYGGNANKTTRFRRYIGEPGNRPLRPEDEKTDKNHLLRPNVPTKIRLVADGNRIEYWRDGEKVFDYQDPKPYRSGWFGFRTVQSHIEVRCLRIGRP